MVAERAADIIRGRKLLSASEATVTIDPNWQQQQRSALPKRTTS